MMVHFRQPQHESCKPFIITESARCEAAGAHEERPRVHHPPDPPRHGRHWGQDQEENHQNQTNRHTEEI